MALGTRAVIKEEEEKSRSSGKILKKLVLGDYTWLKYNDLATYTDNFGRGIRELGVKPRDKICIFADTCAEWLIAAQGCFKNAIALTTIYTNLGDDGIEHGVSQTRVNTLITSQELLPKIVRLINLGKLGHLKKIIFFENPLRPPPNDTPEGIKLYTYFEVLALGSKSSLATGERVRPSIKCIFIAS